MKRYSLVLTLALALSAYTSLARAGDGIISYIPDSQEQPAQGPAGLFFKDGRFYVPDPVDHEVLSFNQDGVQQGSIAVPTPFLSALKEDGNLLLFDEAGQGRSLDLSDVQASGRSAPPNASRQPSLPRRKMRDERLHRGVAQPPISLQR
jgi:hypothetical protein